jgi:hypothetical protein
MDPAAVTLQQIPVEKASNDSVQSSVLTIFEVRKVPGGYDLWKDRKFYVFG